MGKVLLYIDEDFVQALRSPSVDALTVAGFDDRVSCCAMLLVIRYYGITK